MVQDWSEVPLDVLVLISRCLNLIEDYLNFGIVCKSWHSVATENNLNSDMPRLEKTRVKLVCCIPSAVEIELPHQNTTENYGEHQTGWLMSFIRKAVLSASPYHTSHYILMVIEGGMRFLSFWRPGDLRWTRVSWEGTNHDRLSDLVDLAAGKMTETRELGDRAFFLGANASISVQASQFPGIKSNHIYFTDDFFETYLAYEEGGGLDMSVFNLADGSIQPHYESVSLSRFCPPIWVTPTLY
ncbi:hypothetical protein HAX54_045612 [Datura stramonium]|uniref:DUF295 domain-containing protein n=1 Tax=Datura stramonium TaxID=4076 RepID=A0ABS8WHV4_DATST|nr:hypothetical protein [Datura stramonium]